MDGATIRRIFLKYFEERGHTVVESAPLIPRNDPTLFFTNAGMVQFKGVFTGEEARDYTRATTVQKCLRVSGKHNDLENVGVTPRHHTFFEMLGNFSFGDYFKKEAVSYAWDLLTRVYGLDGEKLWITIYKDDEEAFALWRDAVGIREDRIVRMGEKDNFWAMGDTGPCGPCSEIHLDRQAFAGKGVNELGPEKDPEGYLEIWNLVFMQFERGQDGVLRELPRPSIDTGMGLERLAAILQGKQSNYDTDLFMPIIDEVGRLCGTPYGKDPARDVSMRVIADHARATAFLVCDGVVPTNEERGYVLRRIMRRAVRHGVKLELNEPFLYKAVERVVEVMGEAFPELRERQSYLLEVVINEEQRFSETLEKGLRLYREEADALLAQGQTTLPGEFAFRLSDTYGFPLDLTELIAGEDGLSVDRQGYEKDLARQREMARKAWKGSGEEAVAGVYQSLKAGGIGSEFVGYDRLTAESPILALIRNGEPVEQAEEGDEVELITRQTCFYGESGGQVGDKGWIGLPGGRKEGAAAKLYETESLRRVSEKPTPGGATASALFRVDDTQIPVAGLIVHRGAVTAGRLRVGDQVRLEVDAEARAATRRNHTATHLAHAALRHHLGPHVAQRGSLVAPDRLRFDFLHFRQMTLEEIRDVEDWVNRAILANAEVNVGESSLQEATAAGVIALFGEKYGERVRVVRIPDYSAELCGGTHCSRTGDIGLFKIVSEAGIQAGVRRIEAVTGLGSLALFRTHEKAFRQMSEVLKVGALEVLPRVERLIEEKRLQDKQIETLKRTIAGGTVGPDLDAHARKVAGITVLSVLMDVDDPKALREQSDRFRDKIGSGIVCLGARTNDKASVLVAVTPDLVQRFSAGKIVKEVAAVIDGKGGGRPDFAQAGGRAAEKLEEALQAVYDVVARMAG